MDAIHVAVRLSREAIKPGPFIGPNSLETNTVSPTSGTDGATTVSKVTIPITNQGPCIGLVYTGQFVANTGEWLLADGSLTGEQLFSWLDGDAAKVWFPVVDSYLFNQNSEESSALLRVATPLAGDSSSWTINKNMECGSISSSGGITDVNGGISNINGSGYLDGGSQHTSKVASSATKTAGTGVTSFQLTPFYDSLRFRLEVQIHGVCRINGRIPKTSPQQGRKAFN
ncbi:unnamed protein product [Protopolystoma xenopodis]|uniref:Uncharacterized protein n=1 Tax=Protopolystoma xenopodis TaxID=117903 RepID=A0A3S4ZYI2_9PLAT|nr:unnamed protein product [Protopolystoma xenopodis]